MRRSIWLAAAVAFAIAASTSWLLSQPVVQNQVTGQECWQVGQGPGGPGQFICLNTIRGTTPQVVLTAVSGNFTVGTASGNFTVVSGGSGTVTAEGGSTIITAQPSAAVITMPSNPVVDGSVVRICNGTNSAFSANAVTVAANTGQTMVPTGAAITLTTLAAATCVAYQWAQSNTSWYKVQ